MMGLHADIKILSLATINQMTACNNMTNCNRIWSLFYHENNLFQWLFELFLLKSYKILMPKITYKSIQQICSCKKIKSCIATQCHNHVIWESDMISKKLKLLYKRPIWLVIWDYFKRNKKYHMDVLCEHSYRIRFLYDVFYAHMTKIPLCRIFTLVQSYRN